MAITFIMGDPKLESIFDWKAVLNNSNCFKPSKYSIETFEYYGILSISVSNNRLTVSPTARSIEVAKSDLEQAISSFYNVPVTLDFIYSNDRLERINIFI